VKGLRGFMGRGRSVPDDQLVALTDEDRRYLTTLHDETTPLPSGAEEVLRPDHPGLVELRERYAALDLPVTQASRWHRDAVESFLDLRWFRGETLITWHYRELPRISRLKYFVYARYVKDRDELGLLDRLEEDGAFGCWTFDYPGWGRFSRDLLDSANELGFLERELQLSHRDARVLDVGAGYGRLAHRAVEGLDHVAEWCCVDAVPESTWVSDYYLRYRGADPPARVVPLDEMGAFAAGDFDLAINIHSFSECTLAAIEWWMDRLETLEIPRLLIIPNDGDRLLSLEPDGTRIDFAPLLAAAGYRLTTREPVIDDPAVADLLQLHDEFHLFERA
jgi:SAM-dependent methyltransferase